MSHRSVRLLSVMGLVGGCFGGAQEVPEHTTGVTPIAVPTQIAAKADTVGPTFLWSRRGEPMQRRLEPGMVDQPNRQRVLLYGGWTTDGVLADTWEWDGIGWTRRIPDTNPGPRMSPATVYDPVQSRVLLFGGIARTAPQMDLAETGLWEWNGRTWARVVTPTTPSARGGASMAYDAASRRVWMFGGGTDIARSGASESSVTSDELWSFDGADWSQVPKAGEWPSPRSNAGAAWDAARNRFVIHGGYDTIGIDQGFVAVNPEGFRNDTWEWDGARWTRWQEGTLPLEQGVAAMTFDETTQRLLLVAEYPFAGTTQVSSTLYRGDGTRWTAGPSRPLIDVAYDPAHPEAAPTLGTLVFAKGTWSAVNHGFLQTSGFEATTNASFLGTLHEHDWLARWDEGFSRFDSTLRPEGVASAGTALLGTHVFVFGGLNGDGVLRDALVHWDGGRWGRVPHSAPWPAGRRDPGMAALGTDRIVLFGGRDSAGNRNDTWIWTRAPGTEQAGTWSPLPDGVSAPPARYGMAMVSFGNKIVLWGGDGEGPGDVLNDTWQFDGSTWQELHPATAPPGRRSPSAALAADGGMRLFGGGINGATQNSILSDLWDLRIDGATATWTKLADPAATRRRRAGMATDRGRTLLYGGSGDNARSELYDLTAGPGIPYTGVVREDNQDRPTRRYMQTFSSNPGSGGMLSFGGFSSDSNDNLDDTWQLEQLGNPCTDSAQCSYGRSCTEGVCCESSACGPCNTCAAEGSRGLCVPRGSYGPQPGCDAGGRTCSADGHCRLEDQQRCASDEACASGTCLNGGQGGVCCTAAGCAVRCAEGTNDLQTPDGTKISCGAYGCSADRCNTTCTTVADCASGAVCNEQKQCVLPDATPTGDAAGCSCHTAPATAPSTGAAAVAVLALTLRRRRKSK